MARTTQKQQQKKSFVLVVLDRVISCQRLPYPKEVNKSLSAITYHSRKLLSLGLIRKIGFNTGIYKTSVDRDRAIRLLRKNTKKKFVTTKKSSGKRSKHKRVHNIQYKAHLPKFDYWYSILEKYLKAKKIEYHKNKKNQIKIVMEYEGSDYIFFLCKKCIIGYIPKGKDFVSDDVDFAMSMCEAHINKLLSKFCIFFGKDLRVKGELKFEITRRHIAMMDSIVAKKMNKKRKYIEVWVGGKLRMISDISFFDELEAINNKEAISDVKAVENLLEDVIKNKETISDVKSYTDQEVKYLLEKLKIQNKCIEVLKDSQDKTTSIVSKIINEKGFNVSDFTK